MHELFPRYYMNSDNNIEFMGATEAFTCYHCGGFASHNWTWSLKHDTFPIPNSLFDVDVVISATCAACKHTSIWLKNLTPYIDAYEHLNHETLLYPFVTPNVDSPNSDLPTEIIKIYNEASKVLPDSPRASAALSRLAIQHLVDFLLPNEKGDLNNKIGVLVRTGLSPMIQQALDTVRVIGNNAVHPGIIEIEDNYDLAKNLLDLINVIANQLITLPKQIDELYSTLPDNSLKGIENRDNKNQK